MLTLSDRSILYRLRILKTDRETGKTITLAHTSFKLKDANGETVRQTVHYPTEKEIDTFTTDETGGVTLPETLRWGLYYIEEISAPEGYLIQTEFLPVMIGHDGDEPGQTYELNIEMQDEPVKGQILVKKTGDTLVGFETVDAYGYVVQKPVYEQRNLAGAVFELRAAEEIVGRDGTAWYAEGELVDTIITTTGGEDASKLLPLGRYTLTEVKAPEGYAPDNTPHEIELAYADDQTPLVKIRVEVGNTYLPAAITLHKEAEVIRTTEANGEVLRTLHSEPGEGFVFGLFSERDIRENGVTLLADTLVAVGMTDENGRLTFDGTFPHGDYYVRELQAKTGWKLNPNRFPITLEPGGDAVIRVELAQPIYDDLVYTPVTLTKTDITGAKTVPGAQIEVRNEQGEMIYRATTDANGEIPDIPVTPGTYTFREILAPSGYALNEAETRFTVDEQGNVTGNTMLRDDYTRVQLRKQDENGAPLSGVEFALVTETGTRLTTAVSDANGLVTFEKIPYGRYTVEETQPLPGYFKAAVHVRLTVDGTFINPNEPLETVTNTPMRLAYKKVDTSGRPLAGVELDHYEARHPGCDEYNVKAQEIWHDPYVLCAIISAYLGGEEWTIDSAYPVMERYFKLQYVLTEKITTETRYRTEQRVGQQLVTDPKTGAQRWESYTYEIEVPYTYRICDVKLENKNLSHQPVYSMSREKMGLYALYMSTLGNMPDLFAGKPHASQLKDPLLYDVPEEYKQADPQFGKLIEEAEKYLGFPYVWGGSSPDTSFDCSGFVSYVFTNSGVYNTGRLGATGLYGICQKITADEARPGDLIFFEGTMGEDVGGITHVGLYVGDNMMIHCGNPITYADLTRSYWQQHFYGFGRIPYDP